MVIDLVAGQALALVRVVVLRYAFLAFGIVLAQFTTVHDFRAFRAPVVPVNAKAILTAAAFLARLAFQTVLHYIAIRTVPLGIHVVATLACFALGRRYAFLAFGQKVVTEQAFSPIRKVVGNTLGTNIPCLAFLAMIQSVTSETLSVLEVVLPINAPAAT